MASFFILFFFEFDKWGNHFLDVLKGFGLATRALAHNATKPFAPFQRTPHWLSVSCFWWDAILWLSGGVW